MYFAEFLNHSSLDRLSILYLPTCVGCGYGHHANSLLGFSWQLRISHFAIRLGITSQARELRIYLQLALHAYPRTTNAWDDLPSCVPLQLPARGWSVRSKAAP
jgi:hypothetical protein